MKVDDIMKFCHGYKDGNDENKVKCSFWTPFYFIYNI